MIIISFLSNHDNYLNNFRFKKNNLNSRHLSKDQGGKLKSRLVMNLEMSIHKNSHFSKSLNDIKNKTVD